MITTRKKITSNYDKCKPLATKIFPLCKLGAAKREAKKAKGTKKGRKQAKSFLPFLLFLPPFQLRRLNYQ
jgi:hypothetical protein